MNKSSIVWYTFNDLRVHDHEPLLKAHRESESVNHVIFLDKRLFTVSNYASIPKIGRPRAQVRKIIMHYIKVKIISNNFFFME